MLATIAGVPAPGLRAPDRVHRMCRRRWRHRPARPTALNLPPPAPRAGRLKGTLLGVSSQPCMPLSVEGQAHRLIEEASNKDNLGLMYIWW